MWFRRLVLTVALIAASPGTSYAARGDLTHYVNPFIGTYAGASNFGTGGGAANTFPGPVLPHGMIQLGPDTRPASENIGGGYSYGDSIIRGFSVTHLSGPGCPNFGDFPITPTTASIKSSPVQQGALDPSRGYMASFAHRYEAARPGYYRVLLNPSTPEPIGVELTTTVRAALARLQYPRSAPANLLINPAGSAGGNRAASVQIDPAQHEVSGRTTSGGFCLQPNNYTLYFVARFDHPFKSFGTWRRQQLSPGSTSSSDSFVGEPLTYYPFAGPYIHSSATAQAGAYVSFDPGSRIVVRVGISYVSVEEARQNLERETAGWSFDQIRARARRAWNQVLATIQVHRGPLDWVRRFYTALYQAQIEPNTFSDADGRYIGMDGQIHVARGYTQYANFSGWDIYRSQIPLLAMIAPRATSDAIQSLLADASQSGWLPKWPVANGQTGVMTGDPADPIIADAYVFGARGFDAHLALAAMLTGATQEGQSANDGYIEREGLPYYLRLGYVPAELNANVITEGVGDWMRVVPSPANEDAGMAWGSAGTTLEYATDDFAISQVARALGEGPLCRTFLARSGNWRNVFNPATGYVEPRSAIGTFIPHYDDNSNDPFSSEGFAEGDAAQYTWMIPEDPAGLFAAMGGSAAASERLNRFFTELNAGPSSPYAFLGNEPTLGSPWLFDWLGEPYRTQQVLRRALTGLYPVTAGGFPGNDDMGEMSAWYVFGALGLYPETPGRGVLALATPMFRKITVLLGSGQTLTLRAPHAGPAMAYIHALRVGGRVWTRPWITLSQLRAARQLDFRLSAKPDTTWGAAPADSPPSFPPAGGQGCA